MNTFFSSLFPCRETSHSIIDQDLHYKFFVRFFSCLKITKLISRERGVWKVFFFRRLQNMHIHFIIVISLTSFPSSMSLGPSFFFFFLPLHSTLSASVNFTFLYNSFPLFRFYNSSKPHGLRH